MSVGVFNSITVLAVDFRVPLWKEKEAPRSNAAVRLFEPIRSMELLTKVDACYPKFYRGIGTSSEWLPMVDGCRKTPIQPRYPKNVAQA